MSPKTTFTLFCSITLSLFSLVSLANQGGKKKGWIACQSTNPAITLVSPVISKRDGCSGNAKIQGKMWKCGKLEEIESRTHQFSGRIRSAAEKKCEEHCEARGKGCKGRYRGKDACGFSVKTGMANHMGERVGCRSDCEGKSFAYCSVYHSSLLSVNEALMAKETPNCFCRKVAKSKWKFWQ